MNIDPILRFTDSTNNEFYPTPEPLVKKMLSGIELYNFKTILEPSAGKEQTTQAWNRRAESDL